MLADPCAGEGDAIRGLRSCLGLDPSRAPILACEMEHQRYRTLAAKAQWPDRAFHGDAFRLVWTEPPASLLFLNPPYDADPEWGRLEARFLDRFSRMLTAQGVLLLVVPRNALRACAPVLAAEYTELAAWRFPDPQYQAFKQVVVRGVKTAVGRRPHRETVERIEEWGRAPLELPPLGEAETSPAALRPGDFAAIQAVDVARVDLQGAVAGARPFEESLGDLSVADLIGRKFPTALPPKPTHLALALATGHFNGHEIRPDAGRPGFPPVLLKGMFRRVEEETGRSVADDGTVERITTVERPSLEIFGLRLDTMEFFEPEPSSVPSGADRLEEANTADLIVAYSDALTELMARQFPALHDPMDGDAFIPLPRLPRRPYRAQYGGIQAALKLMTRGTRPKFVAEVGTGKTTMALVLCAALSPGHYAATLTGTREVMGRRVRLPLVRRSLVICPPHLLDTWEGEAREVWPRARVVRIESLADIDRDGEIYLLSREAAKLGPQARGVQDRCPRCGRPISTSADENARKRLRCAWREIVPTDTWAGLAQELALSALPALRDYDLARQIAARHRILARTVPSPERVRAALIRLLPALAAAVAEHGSDTSAADGLHAVVGVLVRAAAALEELPRIERWRQRVREREDLAGVTALVDHVLACEITQETDLEAVVRRAFRDLSEAGSWEEGASCGEPLYQFTPEPRRWPIAHYIAKHRRNRFDLLILDEAHEYNNLGTAQQKAAHRLVELGMPTIVLTGSIMNGYASSLFANWWALDCEFRKEFGRDERKAFVERYGFVKREYRQPRDRDPEYGAVTDRDSMARRTAGETPGVLPVFLLRHLLPGGIVLHKEDLELDLPPMEEHQVVLEPETGDDAALLAGYRELRDALVQRIHADRGTPLQGKLWGQLAELPSYLDRATDDQGRFEMRYPEDVGGELIATGKVFPAEWQTPKERWLLSTLREELNEGRKVLVFLRHTGGGKLPARLLRLVQNEATEKAEFLDVAKVPAKKREAWIDRHVLGRGVEVLLVNPNAVRTGLNNLVSFSTAIWYEIDYSASTYRQANGRLHRPGQRLTVRIYFPAYGSTAQKVALELIAKKVTASLQVDGLSIQGALEAAGIGAGERDALDATLQIGEAIYRRLVGDAAAASSASIHAM